jgi:hypothetical protein
MPSIADFADSLRFRAASYFDDEPDQAAELYLEAGRAYRQQMTESGERDDDALAAELHCYERHLDCLRAVRDFEEQLERRGIDLGPSPYAPTLTADEELLYLLHVDSKMPAYQPMTLDDVDFDLPF